MPDFAWPTLALAGGLWFGLLAVVALALSGSLPMAAAAAIDTVVIWAPHHDDSEIGRYRDTRISLFFGADILYLYQNLHLIHHMLPSIPFYRYRAAFEELLPLLERHGARIEGFWPTSPARSRIPQV